MSRKWVNFKHEEQDVSAIGAIIVVVEGETVAVN